MAVYEYTIKKRNPYGEVDKEKGGYTWYMYDGKYKKIDGKLKGYKKMGFAKKEHAEKAEQEFLQKKIENSKDIVLNDLWETYEHYSKMHKQKSTCYEDKLRYDKHIKPNFGDLPIRSISPTDIIKWQEKLLEKLSHTTVVNLHKTFSKLLSFADRIYDTDWHPLNKVGYPKRLSKHEQTEIWTNEEFRRFYNSIDTKEYQTLFMVFFYCGLRRGELLALRWNDFKNGFLEIDESIANVMGKQEIKPPKNFNAERFIQLDDRTNQLLQELYEVKSKKQGFSEYNYIFGEKGDKPMGFETLRKAKVRYEIKAGVKHIRIHDLRHSHVSLLINEQFPLIAVAERIGDTVEEIMRTYSHVIPKSNDEIYEYLNELTKEY